MSPIYELMCWRVLHVSWTMFESDTAGVLEFTAVVLEEGR